MNMQAAEAMQHVHKKRMVSVEALRILAMFMVIMLHYLSKGELLSPLTGELTINGFVAWGMEAFAIVAVNTYVLISGFFLVESGFRPGRLAELICQVLFYSILVPVVLIALGILSLDSLSTYQLLQFIFPTQMEHYWFATAYVILYLLAPVLSTAAKTMGRIQLRNTIIGLLLLLSVGKSVLPVKLEIDDLGYGALWFLCVFLVAAYMRLYGIGLFRNGKRSLCLYLVSCAGIYGWTMLLRFVYLKTGHFADFVQSAYSYNHILNLFASIALFYAFYYWKPGKENAVSGLILKAAPYTFGVYLLHEHLEIRWLWPGWLGATSECGVAEMVIRAVGAALLVLLVGICVDMLRGRLFGWVKGLTTKAAPEK